jgi:hypothetical protein
MNLKVNSCKWPSGTRKPPKQRFPAQCNGSGEVWRGRESIRSAGFGDGANRLEAAPRLPLTNSDQRARDEASVASQASDRRSFDTGRGKRDAAEGSCADALRVPRKQLAARKLLSINDDQRRAKLVWTCQRRAQRRHRLCPLEHTMPTPGRPRARAQARRLHRSPRRNRGRLERLTEHYEDLSGCELCARLPYVPRSNSVTPCPAFYTARTVRPARRAAPSWRVSAETNSEGA